MKEKILIFYFFNHFFIPDFNKISHELKLKKKINPLECPDKYIVVVVTIFWFYKGSCLRNFIVLIDIILKADLDGQHGKSCLVYYVT